MGGLGVGWDRVGEFQKNHPQTNFHNSRLEDQNPEMSDAVEQPLLAGDLEAGGGGSPDVVTKMDAVFANFDKDGNGTISPSELRAAMQEVC